MGRLSDPLAFSCMEWCIQLRQMSSPMHGEKSQSRLLKWHPFAGALCASGAAARPRTCLCLCHTQAAEACPEEERLGGCSGLCSCRSSKNQQSQAP